MCMREGFWAVKWNNVCFHLVTQLLHKHWNMGDDHWDVETLISAHFTKRDQTQVLTFEFRMYSGLNMSGLITTLWCMLRHKSHKNDTGEFFLRDHFPLRVIKYHHTECSNPFVVLFRECSFKYSLNTIPSVACRHLKFHYKIFYRFINNKIWHVSKGL